VENTILAKLLHDTELALDITTPSIFFTEFGHIVFEEGLNFGTLFHKRSKQLFVMYA
jgi:hypothetical protein